MSNLDIVKLIGKSIIESRCGFNWDEFLLIKETPNNIVKVTQHSFFKKYVLKKNIQLINSFQNFTVHDDLFLSKLSLSKYDQEFLSSIQYRRHSEISKLSVDPYDADESLAILNPSMLFSKVGVIKQHLILAFALSDNPKEIYEFLSPIFKKDLDIISALFFIDDSLVTLSDETINYILNKDPKLSLKLKISLI